MKVYIDQFSSDFKIVTSRLDYLSEFVYFLQFKVNKLKDEWNKRESNQTNSDRSRRDLCAKLDQIGKLVYKMDTTSMNYIQDNKLEQDYSEFILKLPELLNKSRNFDPPIQAKKNDPNQESDQTIRANPNESRYPLNHSQVVTFDSMDNRENTEQPSAKILDRDVKNFNLENIVAGSTKLIELDLAKIPMPKDTSYAINRLCTQYPSDPQQKNENPILLLHLTRTSNTSNPYKPPTSKDIIYHLPETKEASKLNFRRLPSLRTAERRPRAQHALDQRTEQVGLPHHPADRARDSNDRPEAKQRIRSAKKGEG